MPAPAQQVWNSIIPGNVIWWRKYVNVKKTRHPFVVLAKHIEDDEESLLLVQTTSQTADYIGRFDVVEIGGNRTAHQAIKKPCVALAYELHHLKFDVFVKLYGKVDALETESFLVEVDAEEILETRITREICNCLRPSMRIDKKYLVHIDDYLLKTPPPLPPHK